MNKELFKYFQALNGDTGKSTAKALNIMPQTLSSRLNGSRGDFTRAEIAILKERWHLTDEQCSNIFFATIVSLGNKRGRNNGTGKSTFKRAGSYGIVGVQ